MTVRLVIPGEPRGKGRPRFRVVKARRGANFVQTYTDEKTRAYEAHVAKCAQAVMVGRLRYEGAICVRVMAYFEPPKSASKAQRAAMLAGQMRPVTKSDADNIAKSVLDGMQDIVFADDKQVCGLAVEKHYAERARVEVAVWPVGLVDWALRKVGMNPDILAKERPF